MSLVGPLTTAEFGQQSNDAVNFHTAHTYGLINLGK